MKIRAIDSLVNSQGVSDLYRMYVYTQRDGYDYNLAYIPADFDVEPKSEFDKAYMQKLFALGYQMGRKGYPWSKYPPGFQCEG